MQSSDLTSPLLAPVTIRLDNNENRTYAFKAAQEKPRASGYSIVWPFVPERHFLPCAESYHSGRVIAGSASRWRYSGKFRALARATSGSLTTRKPKAFELSGECIAPFKEGASRIQGIRLFAAQLRSRERSMGFPIDRRVGARAVSDNRTYRRLETEQRKSYELRGNRGSKLKQNFQNHFEGKSCSVSESRGNSFLSQCSGGLS